MILLTRNRFAALALAALAACRDASTGADSRACQQSYEFGNSGCAEVSGQAVGLRGQALQGISVFARGSPDFFPFSSGYVVSDASGAFRVRITRMFGSPPADRAQDTVSVYVVARNQPVDWATGQPRVQDSVFTLVRVSPVGSVPEASSLRIVLPIP
ncbi:MAG: hypothetical protein ABI910_23480 [Gemmatimonadota bacterium]